MNINRNNYESFFLLYADNELSAADRMAVELFVEENADLQEEFSQILQLQLPSEKLQFNKASLLRPEGYISPLEEKLLLYLDGEANENQKQEIEHLLATDKEIAASFALLKKTQLPASEILSFENKQVLYRHEPAKIFAVKYLRWAAAAILIGIGLFAGFKIKKSGEGFNSNPKNNIAQNPSINPQKNYEHKKDSNQGNKPANEQQSNIALANNSNNNNLSTTTQNLKEKNDSYPTPNKKLNPEMNASLANTSVPETIQKPNSNEQTQIAAIPKKPELQANIIPKEPVLQPIKEEESLASNSSPKNIIDENITPLKEQFAQAASFNEIADENNDNKILMMNEEQVKKSKLGIFFRKIKRNIERRANIKTGKKLKIANFEIAAN